MSCPLTHPHEPRPSTAHTLPCGCVWNSVQTNRLNVERGEWTLLARSPRGVAAGSWALACKANSGRGGCGPVPTPLRPGGATRLCRGRAGEPPVPKKSPWKGAARTAREVSPWDAGTSQAPPQTKREKPRAVLWVNLPDSWPLLPQCPLLPELRAGSQGGWHHTLPPLRLPESTCQPHRQQERGRAGPALSPSQGPWCHTRAHTDTCTETHTHTHAHTCPQTHVQTHVHTETRAQTHTHTCPQTHVQTHVHTQAYTTHVPTDTRRDCPHRHTCTQTHVPTDTRRDCPHRHTCTQTHGPTDTRAHRHICPQTHVPTDHTQRLFT